MNIEEALKTRRSVRAFQKTDIDKHVIERIINMASWSPSPMNTQPWSFTILRGQQRDALVKIISGYPDYLQDIFDGSGIALTNDMTSFVESFSKDLGGAPVIIVISVNKYLGSHWQDLARRAGVMAGYALMLAAHAEGLGTVYLTSSLAMEDRIKDFLKIYNQEISIVIPLGYPQELPESTGRMIPKMEWIGY